MTDKDDLKTAANPVAGSAIGRRQCPQQIICIRPRRKAKAIHFVSGENLPKVSRNWASVGESRNNLCAGSNNSADTPWAVAASITA